MLLLIDYPEVKELADYVMSEFEQYPKLVSGSILSLEHHTKGSFDFIWRYDGCVDIRYKNHICGTITFMGSYPTYLTYKNVITINIQDMISSLTDIEKSLCQQLLS
ncbi:hypothetical protein FDJ06_gp321 [Pseudomonas phage SL2]|uniref:Uncharacterized protein n=1 Tax=Pseudomonas phage SL2 TaxID=2041345 RepID=A0A2D1GRE2_9CAUD|nr:hypothetical protein FDJ06_gp321 [Pseudomonas phage SL2]ATN94898.1 hypothetical protein SL2_321 [Pseudomonas phage SL2]